MFDLLDVGRKGKFTLSDLANFQTTYNNASKKFIKSGGLVRACRDAINNSFHGAGPANVTTISLPAGMLRCGRLMNCLARSHVVAPHPPPPTCIYALPSPHERLSGVHSGRGAPQST